VPWRFDVVETELKRGSGLWLPLQKPLLGIEVTEREAAKRPFAQETFQQSIFLEDASVAEW
jgi:galactonate dehydratase